MGWTAILSPAATVLVAVVGAYVAMKNANNDKFAELMAQNAEQTAEIRALKEQVEKHNGVLERVFKLERDMKAAFVRIDELKEADMRLDERMRK